MAEDSNQIEVIEKPLHAEVSRNTRDLTDDLINEGLSIFGARDEPEDEYYENGEAEKSIPLDNKYSNLLMPGDRPSDFWIVSYYQEHEFDSNASSKTKGEITAEKVFISTTRTRKEQKGNSKEYRFIRQKGAVYRRFTSGELNPEHYYKTEASIHKLTGLEKPRADIDFGFILSEDGINWLPTKQAYISRTDETMIEFNGFQTPASLTRAILDYSWTGEKRSSYTEEFQIIENGEPLNISISFGMEGPIDNPQKISIRIGGGLKADVIGKDKKNGIEIVLSYSHFEDEARRTYELLKRMPDYSFLKSSEVDGALIRKFLQERIYNLQLQWDNPETVFANPFPQIDSKHVSPDNKTMLDKVRSLIKHSG